MMNTEILDGLIKDMETLAFSMDPPNQYTPQFVSLALQMRLATCQINQRLENQRRSLKGFMELPNEHFRIVYDE